MMAIDGTECTHVLATIDRAASAFSKAIIARAHGAERTVYLCGVLIIPSSAPAAVQPMRCDHPLSSILSFYPLYLYTDESLQII
jgi:hypothetical protein